MDSTADHPADADVIDRIIRNDGEIARLTGSVRSSDADRPDLPIERLREIYGQWATADDRLVLGVGSLENRPAGRDLDSGNPPCVQHQEPAAVPAEQHAGLLRQSRDDVVDDLALARPRAVVVRDVHGVAADEADAKHKAFHVSGH